MAVIEVLSHTTAPEMADASEEQQQFLLFLADMEAASEVAKADGASDDAVKQIYEAYGDQLHSFVQEDIGKGRQILGAAMDFLQQHDCSLEGLQNLSNAYEGRHGNDDHASHSSEHEGSVSKSTNSKSKNGKAESKTGKKRPEARKLGWWLVRRVSIFDFFRRESGSAAGKS